MDELKVDLVREVPEYCCRDDGDTPQRRYKEPHDFLHIVRIFLATSGYERGEFCWPDAIGSKASKTAGLDFG